MSDTTPTPSVGTLFLVATPIGNLEDITARALRVLREVSLVAAEDTRVTRKLLAHFDIHTPLTAYHEYSTDAKENALLARLLHGDSVALVSDAGTPAISDPGAELVAVAIRNGVRVEPIPGACAVIAAVIGSGLPTGRWTFEGFLPRPKSDRRERLGEIARESRTMIFYEGPHRLKETLTDLQKTFGPDRPACVAREVTKKFEEWVRGSLTEISAHFDANEPRGECVIVVSGRTEGEVVPDAPDAVSPESLICAALERGLTPKDAAREVAAATGMSRNDAYTLVQSLRGA
ncbi:MAG: 16S rRNA (cytidine(1402)-2'-O)-methyltransferase [Akkermansiaceae bacterium]|nr:16S rRNA (cytidine(1402)-2'-O)-methyltransferase [Armatimonadota bacterium]